jgi:CBS domain containing-hemolysin-like protein
MDSDSWLIIFLSLVFSAFFSGMEIAFVSANKLKIELDAKQGSYPAKLIRNYLAKPKLFISTMLVGNNLALVIYGIETGELLSQLLYGTDAWEQATRPYVALTVQTIISTVVIVVTAEFLPKSIFRINPNGWLKGLVFPLSAIFLVLFIPASIVNLISKGFLKLFLGADMSSEQQNFGSVDLDHYLQEITSRMTPDQDLEHEIQILQNALDFSHLKARDCLIPRNEIIAMSIDDDIESLRRKFIETGLSKMVIYRDNIDNIIGYVHIRDAFKKPENLKKILMPAFIVPEPMAANEVLESFIKKKRNLAVVVDEYGGTSGILTIEDVVEEIFGEIEDEHDKEELVEKQLSETEFQFSARLEIDYLNEEYDLNLPESDDYDTLGGLIIHHLEDIPSLNEIVIIGPYQFKMKKVAETRIDLVDLIVVQNES